MIKLERGKAQVRNRDKNRGSNKLQLYCYHTIKSHCQDGARLGDCCAALPALQCPEKARPLGSPSTSTKRGCGCATHSSPTQEAGHPTSISHPCGGDKCSYARSVTKPQPLHFLLRNLFRHMKSGAHGPRARSFLQSGGSAS